MTHYNHDDNSYGYELLGNQVSGCYRYAPSAEDVLIHNMELEALRKGMDELSSSDRRLLKAVCFDSDSITHYAKRTKQDILKVKKQKKAIFDRLRKLVENV